MRIAVEWIKATDTSGQWRLYAYEQNEQDARNTVDVLKSYGHRARIVDYGKIIAGMVATEGA